MRIVLLVAYGLSVLISAGTFYGFYFMTEPLIEGSSGGGNGNPALILLVFTMPFLMYFLYGTVELAMRLTSLIKQERYIWITIVISALSASWILIATFLEAVAFRQIIFARKEQLNSVEDIALLNTFSNSIFFNPLTFLMVLLVCNMIGGVWALSRKEKQPIGSKIKGGTL